MDRFNPDDYNILLDKVSDAKVLRILEENDRDYISKHLWKIILAKPSLLRFAGKMI